METLPYALVATLGVGILLATSNSVGSPNDQSLESIRNSGANEAVLLVQNSSPREATSGNRIPANVNRNRAILKGHDTVAYFKQGKALKGNPAIESSYQGVTYLFASAANKVEFERDPAKYAPPYSAFCAYGIANGVQFPADDPNAFAIYKGKLYLCGDQNALKISKTNINDNIGKADTYWLQVTKS